MITLQYIVAFAANAALLVGTKLIQMVLDVSLELVVKFEYVAVSLVEVRFRLKLYKYVFVLAL
jgi:hypothetical protein